MTLLRAEQVWLPRFPPVETHLALNGTRVRRAPMHDLKDMWVFVFAVSSEGFLNVIPRESERKQYCGFNATLCE